MLLFGAGAGYGLLVTHLHKTQQITPLPVMDVERNPLYYQLLWGVLGVLLGNALPLVDSFWKTSTSGHQFMTSSSRTPDKLGTTEIQDTSSTLEAGLGPLWYSAVRSIGVFVGIAFAVVRLHLFLPVTLADFLSDGSHGSRPYKLP
jgi:hypothetical protein